MLDSKGDVGFFEDVVTVLLNLVHSEEHAKNSFFMTGNEEWLEIAYEVRKDRSEILELVTFHEDSQIWCWNKHTLKAIEGLTEMANRKYAEGKFEEAKNYYLKSAKYLGLFYEKNNIGGKNVPTEITKKTKSGKMQDFN